jgi:hypothetical protein
MQERIKAMKAVFTALGICALLATPISAFAADFSWTGGIDQWWSTGTNWPGQGGYPDDSGDTATIAATSPSYWPSLDANYTIGELAFSNGSSATPQQITTDDGASAWTLTVSSAGAYDGKVIVTDTDSECYVEQLGDGEIDAQAMDIIAGDSASEDAVYKLNDSDGTLDVQGCFLVQASESYDADATIWISSGTFTPEAMTFDGGTGDAIGDFDVSVTVQGTGGDSRWDTWVQGSSVWSIASGATVNVKDLELDGTNTATLSVTGAGPDVSTLNTTSFESNGRPMSLTAVRWSDV